MPETAQPLPGAVRPTNSPSWTVVPTLAVVGIASSIFFVWCILPEELHYSSYGETPFQMLAGACFSAAVSSALALRREVSIRAAAICTGVTIALIFLAEDRHSPFYKILSSEYRGEFYWATIYRALAIVPAMYLAFQWYTARGRRGWVPWVGLQCAAAAIATLAWFDYDHRRNYFSTTAGITLDESWQVTIAGFLGLALWLQAIVAKRRGL
jgi:hypothetical protein